MSTETGVDVKAVQEDSSGGDTCQAEDYFGAGCESPHDQCQEGNLDSLVVASPQGEVNGQGMDDQVPATQQSAMEEDCPATQRNGDSPVARCDRLNYECRLPSADDEPLPDPLEGIKETLRAVTTTEALSEVLEPEDLFTNCQNTHVLQTTIIAALEAVCETNPRSVADVANDPRFELHLQLPKPMFQAIRAIGKAEGWPLEALCQGLMAGVGWLHHEGTRISIQQEENHGRTTAIPSFFAAPPSCRKTSLHQFLTDDLLGVSGIPKYAKAKEAFRNSGTLRGHRNNLYNFGRTGLATSEVTGTYRTSKSGDGVPASQFAQKSNINKWCHSEPDRSITGQMRYQHDVYAFYHLVYGQIGPTLEVLTGSTSADLGFQKRFNVVFETHVCQQFPLQMKDHSKNLLRSLMQWLASRLPPAQQEAAEEKDAAEAAGHDSHGLGPSRIVLNAFARKWMRQVLQAIDEFQDIHPDLGAAWLQKLAYADTDVLRWANTVNKCRAYLASLTRIPVNPYENIIDVIDIQYALHAWLRQLQYFQLLQSPQMKGAGEEHSTPDAGLPNKPDAEETIMRWIMTDAGDNTKIQTSKEMRGKLKHKLARLNGWKRKDSQKPAQEEKNPRGQPVHLLLNAINRLQHVQLIDVVGRPAAESGGHEVLKFQKRKWTEIAQDATACEWIKKLRLGQENFP